MRKRFTKIAVVACVVLLAAGVVFWGRFRNPCEPRYFTAEMRVKYSTVESVLGAMREGWRYDSESRAALMNEAYGFDLAKRYGSGKPGSDRMGNVKNISYSRDKKLAFVVGDGFGSFVLWRKGRWVFYPETPWTGLLEMVHG